MKKQSIVLAGFLHAAAATAYIALVAYVMSHASMWFGKTDTQFTPMAVLMLFVLSAGVTASLTFLRPILWYLDNKKREAIWLLVSMIVFFFIFTIAAFACLAIFR